MPIVGVGEAELPLGTEKAHLVQEEPPQGGPTKEDLEWLGTSGWRLVPRRLEILHSSWIFIWASAALLAEFILIYKGYLGDNASLTGDPNTGNHKGGSGMGGKIGPLHDPVSPGQLVNCLGVIEGIFWLHGFFMLDHWLHSIGASYGALTGAYLKTIASVLFCVQPLGGMLGYGAIVVNGVVLGYAGAGWSNLAGICFFHGGNMVSLFDMVVISRGKPGGMDYSNWFSWGNLPVLGMLCYTFGSGLLVPPNCWNYEHAHHDKHHAPSHWAADFATQDGFRIAGATMLLVGSLVFTHWAGWLPKVGKRPKALDNDFWYGVECSY